MAAVQRVVIAGAGVGGLTLALALREAGVAVEVHERHDRPQGRQTGFTLWSYAIAKLQALGLGDVLDEIGSAIEVTEIRNQAGEVIQRMPVGDVSRAAGALTYDVNRAKLLDALAARLSPGELFMSSACTGVEHGDGEVTMLLDGGGRASGDLLVGADGIHSTVRAAVAGPGTLEYSGYTGFGAIVAFEHEQAPPGTHLEIWARGSKGGVASVGAGEVRWYVTTRAPAGRHEVDKAALLDHVAGWPPVLAAAIEATDPATVAVNEAWDLDPLDTWIGERTVLLGDAAHATTPFAAMGACMTIEDALELSELLTDGQRELDEALGEFEQRRKRRTEDTVRHGRRMGYLSQLHSPALAWLRDEGFKHIPPDKLEEVAADMAAGKG